MAAKQNSLSSNLLGDDWEECLVPPLSFLLPETTSLCPLQGLFEPDDPDPSVQSANKCSVGTEFISIISAEKSATFEAPGFLEHSKQIDSLLGDQEKNHSTDCHSGIHMDVEEPS